MQECIRFTVNLGTFHLRTLCFWLSHALLNPPVNEFISWYLQAITFMIYFCCLVFCTLLTPPCKWASITPYWTLSLVSGNSCLHWIIQYVIKFVVLACSLFTIFIKIAKADPPPPFKIINLHELAKTFYNSWYHVYSE